jgi:RNA recognition motif-containing protein
LILTRYISTLQSLTMADNELSDTYETATTPNASEAADARSDAPQVGRAFADTNAAPEEGAIPDDKEDLNASPSSSSAIDPNSSNANNSHPSVPSNSSNIIGSAHIRPIFLGNLDMNVTAEDISDLFTRPALNAQPMSVERVDLKRGFAFVFMNDAQTQGDKDRIEQYVDGIQGMYVPSSSLQHILLLLRGQLVSSTSSAPAA